MKRLLVAAMCLGLVVSVPVRADYFSGLSAYDRGDASTAYREWTASAEQGDARSQYRLGRLYEQGIGTPQDYVEAHIWYNLAAAGGVIDARDARDRLELRMSANQVELAQRQARARQTSRAAPRTGSSTMDTALGLGSLAASLAPVAAPTVAGAAAPAATGTMATVGETIRTVGQVEQGVAVTREVSTAVTGQDVIAGGVDSASRLTDALVSSPSPVPSQAAELAALPNAQAPAAPTAGFRDCDGCPDMIPVPAGSFRMGAEDGDTDERPVHQVYIAYGLAVGRSEVTFAQYDQCVAEAGCPRPAGDEGWGRGAMPVVHVSWGDAKAYAEWLARKTGKSYRLPSEAEWEYFARGGTETPYWWGAAPAAKANCRGCGAGFGSRPVAAATLPPNPFGLTEVLGNLYEWVADCSTADYAGVPADGNSATTGDCALRMVRGGSWQVGPTLIRASTRFRLDPSFKSDQVGFRVVQGG